MKVLGCEAIRSRAAIHAALSSYYSRIYKSLFGPGGMLKVST